MDLIWHPVLRSKTCLPAQRNKIIGIVFYPFRISEDTGKNFETSSGYDVEGSFFCFNYSKKRTAGQIYEKKDLDFRYLFQALNDKI